ncbi:hypothetical protein CONLIGDRAFT_679367 [Coniochaeta ligniaria NRRL 30616]|uniref:Uncharacterized protein n=1 Tax=Coniochaeta ligniaria NRRL 30616 TaxID=1408157 RepID=A0A1J7JMP6_9PEZI|nr:hypothetical protein CONLIGDRAFT_679367 [Coniochaeta ligniaria NRRL 30616]
MKLLLGIIISTVLPLLAAAAAVAPVVDPSSPDFYPAPCGRSIPHGVCLDESTCEDEGGFYVGRDWEWMMMRLLVW